jgi:hypothetical protein
MVLQNSASQNMTGAGEALALEDLCPLGKTQAPVCPTPQSRRSRCPSQTSLLARNWPGWLFPPPVGETGQAEGQVHTCHRAASAHQQEALT